MKHLINDKQIINLMSKKHKKTCRALNYFEHFLHFNFAGRSCFDFCFCFYGWDSYIITSSEVGLEVCTITAVIKKFKSVMKNRKKHDNIAFLIMKL